MKISKEDINLVSVLFLCFSLRVIFWGWGSENAWVLNGELSIIIKSIQHYIVNVSDSLFTQPQSSLLTGIVFGIQSNLPASFKQALQNTSTIHIVVASGQNLTMVAAFLFSLSRFIGRKKVIFLTFGSIIAYSFISGLQIPIIRAAVMVSMSLLAQSLGKESSALRGLCLAGGIMLIFNPSWIMSVSFQLSFLATFASLVVAPLFLRLITFLPEIIKEDLAVSASVQLLIWPVIAFHFHQFSLVDVIVNSLVLWIIPIVMISGAITIAVASILPVLGWVLSFVPQALLTYFVYIINFFNQPWGVIFVGDLSILCIVGYYMLLAGALILLHQKLASNSEPPGGGLAALEPGSMVL